MTHKSECFVMLNVIFCEMKTSRVAWTSFIEKFYHKNIYGTKLSAIIFYNFCFGHHNSGSESDLDSINKNAES